MDPNKSDMTQSKEQLASHYALHVALQTMKERCLSLQQRLTAVEEENAELRKKSGQDQPHRSANLDARSECELLSEQVGELTRQKYQLTEHIGMVALENRQLWLRLSKLTKDNQSLGVSLNKIKTTLTEGTTASSVAHQNLIRSKTFTQNAPNPILRQKMMQQDGNNQMDCDGNEMDDMSLEEVSLKDYTDQPHLMATHSDQIAGAAAGATAQLSATANSMGFGYLNDESINTILMNDTKKCLDSMVDIKKELLRQQSDLKVALSGLRQRRILEVCMNCKNHSSKKANMADKNFGTDDEFYHEHIDGRMDGITTTIAAHRRRQSSENDAEISEIIGDNAAAFMPIKPDASNNSTAATTVIDISQQKRIADCIDKMCPMCGKVYTNDASFEVFQDHVESHFIDDTDLDLSVEKNFEFVSNTVGQF